MDEFIYVPCPHCRAMIEVKHNEINCKIFRHGIYKSSNKQIDPHLCESECKRLVSENAIHGCGKPFRLIKSHQIYEAIVCDYI